MQRFWACRSWGLEVQMLNLVQMFNRTPNAQYSTTAPILANPGCTPYLVIFFTFKKIK
jgi:hypothetical protein